MESGTSCSRSDLTFNPYSVNQDPCFPGKESQNQTSTALAQGLSFRVESWLGIQTYRLFQLWSAHSLIRVRHSCPGWQLTFLGWTQARSLASPASHKKRLCCQWADIKLRGIGHNCLTMLHPRKLSGSKQLWNNKRWAGASGGPWGEIRLDFWGQTLSCLQNIFRFCFLLCKFY